MNEHFQTTEKEEGELIFSDHDPLLGVFHYMRVFVCVSMCVCLSLSVCLCVSMCMSVCIYVHMTVRLCVCLCVGVFNNNSMETYSGDYC